MRLPDWLRRRVPRFDRRWNTDEAERERYDAVVLSRLADRQPAKPQPPAAEEGSDPQHMTTSLVVRKEQPLAD